jgi:hypothetical protein
LSKAAKLNSNNTKNQFWQQHNQSIELWSPKVMDQKLNYIHQNPVVAGFVNSPEDWKYSSAMDYVGNKGAIKMCFLYFFITLKENTIKIKLSIPQGGRLR